MDITGEQYGRLTVVRRAGRDDSKKPLWVARCTCGGRTTVRQDHLRSGHTESCGCLYIESRQVKTDLTGRKFGRLTVISSGDICLVRCTCGAEVEVDYSKIRQRKSCGCLIGGRKHGEGIRGKETKEYFAWENMRQRCLNSAHKKYSDYGGRGIIICKRWLDSYVNFLGDVGRAPGSEFSIDRINNNGNYTPRNVRWATQLVQQNNRRVTA